jgi:hypothetical protein
MRSGESATRSGPAHGERLKWVKRRNTRCEQMSSAAPPITDIQRLLRHVRSVPILLQKSFLGEVGKILKTADALRARRREGPHRFIQKRPPAFVLAAENLAAAAASKNRLSRDFRGRSIFDFCNNICQERTLHGVDPSYSSIANVKLFGRHGRPRASVMSSAQQNNVLA